MAEKKANKSTKVTKEKPTIFPMGFSVSKIEKDLVIIDFADFHEGAGSIIESFVLPKRRVELLIKALNEALSEDDDEN